MQLLKKYNEAKRLRPYKTCALMFDIKGRQIRTGKCRTPGGLLYKAGDRLEMRCDDINILSSQKVI